MQSPWAAQKARRPKRKGQNPRPRNRVDARGEEASAGDPLGRPSSVCKLLITFSTRLEQWNTNELNPVCSAIWSLVTKRVKAHFLFSPI
jgi:hypothetical protein